MTEFTMVLAGQTVRVSALYESTKEFCRGFLLPDPLSGRAAVSDTAGAEKVIEAVSSQAAIDAERARIEKVSPQDTAPGGSAQNDPAGDVPDILDISYLQNGGQQYSDAYLETLAVYRMIAEEMPERNVLLVHGSAVSVDGKGYLFTARSGVGKSTHVRLWREVLPQLGHEVHMINDDKPLLRFTDEGVFACGTPWMGKHRLGANRQVPLAGICYLERGRKNTIKELETGQIWQVLLTQTYRPQRPAAMEKTMALLDRLAHEVPFCHLHCNMERRAAEVSWKGLQEAVRRKG